VHIAKLSREFRHRAIAWTTMLCNLLGGLLGIAMAYGGWGVWALVVSRVFTAVILAGTYWILASWRPRLVFSLQDLRAFIGFSSYLFASQLIGQTNNQATAFIVGAFLGPAALGQFQVGFRAFNLIIGMLIQPLQSAALPAFSRLEGDGAAVGRAYLRMTALCGLVACPVFLGSSAIAYDFVLLVFGPQWADAGAVMALAGLAVAPATHMYFFMPALAARAKTRPAFWGMFVNAAGNILAALVAVPFGVAAVAAAQSARAHLTLPVTLYLLKIGIGVRPIEAVASLAPPFVAAAIMAATLVGVGYGLAPEMSPWLRMGLMVVAGPFVYLPVLALIGPGWLRATLADVAGLLPEKFRRGPFAGSV
jgi:PST family polysaccharide transporter